MPPSTFHHAVTIFSSLAMGIHLHAKHGLVRSILNEYHTIMGEGIVTNANHALVRYELLRIGIHQIHTFLELPKKDWSHHILKLTDAEDMHAMAHLVAFGVVFPALSVTDYSQDNEEELAIYRPRYQEVVYFWGKMGDFERRVKQKHCQIQHQEWKTFSDAIDVRYISLIEIACLQ